MTIALRLFINDCFMKGIKKIKAMTHPENLAAIQVLRKNGFLEEVYFKDKVINEFNKNKEDRILFGVDNKIP